MYEVTRCVGCNHLTTNYTRSAAIVQIEIAARIPISVEEYSIAII